MITEGSNKDLKRFINLMGDMPIWQVKRLKDNLTSYNGDEEFIDECEKEINERAKNIRRYNS